MIPYGKGVIAIAKPKKQTGIETAVCNQEVPYILTSIVMMPTSRYTKFLCQYNGEWIVNTDHHTEFKQMFPKAILKG